MVSATAMTNEEPLVQVNSHRHGNGCIMSEVTGGKLSELRRGSRPARLQLHPLVEMVGGNCMCEAL